MCCWTIEHASTHGRSPTAIMQTYQKRFPFPNGSPPGTVGTYYYSFDLGAVHFVQMRLVRAQ